MTGFGRGEFKNENYHITIEIKSYNHRYLDFTFHIPRNFQVFEERCRGILQSKIFRGKIEVFLQISRKEIRPYEVKLNKSVLDGYYAAIETMRQHYQISETPSLALLVSLPEVFELNEQETNLEELWNYVRIALEEALKNLLTMRENEGKELFNDINERLSHIEAYINKIEARAPFVVEEYRLKITKLLHELLPPEIVDEYQNRLLYEIVLYTEKTNISEEITRFKSHISQFINHAKQTESIGRKLDFLLQEMNREINTIGSKANDLELSSYVVEIKSELEKIREQIQNIE